MRATNLAPMPPNNNNKPAHKISDIYHHPQHHPQAPPFEVKMDFPSVSTIDEGSSLNPNSPTAEEAERSVGQKFKDFADLTTAHGAKRVLIARTRCSKLFWLLLMFALYGMVIYVVLKLTNKYTQHDRITSISIKFDEVEFPAITFCNLNPYKRSLVRLIPSIRDTMDVYDNAKSQGKVRKEKKPKFSRKQHIEMSENLVKDLFREELEEEEARLHNLTDDSSERTERRKRMAAGEPHQIYEAIEAHCRCLGKLDMECIRFESPPRNDNSKCICTLNMDLDKAWPCFNSTIWYDHTCPVCSVQGTCEADYEDDVALPDTMIRPTPDFYGDQIEGFPCTCRKRSHYEGGNGDAEKPYCVRKRSPVEIRRLWVGPTPPTTTAPPPTAPSDHVQRPIVTNPETIKAMGFAGMTDGVAMLTKAKENIMFTMAAMTFDQRVALSQAKREFIEMCSFNGKECDIDKDFKQHVDPEFGNCYTFNYDPKNNLTSSRAGPMYGIRVLLFVNTSDYMSTSESAGIRLAIHPATQYPFPDTFGYSAPVGFASSFGIKKEKIVRLVGYGDCMEEEHARAAKTIYEGYEYNPEGCHRSCFQNRMFADCDCGDPRFPVPAGKKHCSAFNATARKCLESKIGDTGDFHHMTASADDCVCKHACSEVVYSMTFSTSKWPSGASDLGDCEGMSDKECAEFYRQNAAMIEVYYEQLNYELLQESEAYGIVNLIADFGGHLGLWMGFSVITVVEVIALLFDIVQTFCRGRRNRKHQDDFTTLQVENAPKKSRKQLLHHIQRTAMCISCHTNRIFDRIMNTSMDYFVPLDLEESYSSLLKVHFIISSILNCISLYCLIRETPENQQAIRSYLLFIQMITWVNDLNSDILMEPIQLLPLPAAYFIGILGKVSVNLNVMLAIFILVHNAIGVSIVLCFHHKHQTLLDNSSRFKMGSGAYIVLHSACCAICFFIFVCVLVTPIDNSTSDRAMETYPYELKWIRERGPYIVMEKNLLTRVASFIFLGILIFIQFIICAIVAHIYYILKCFKSSQSMSTQQKITRSVIVLYIQLVVPSSFLLVPLFVSFFSLATGTGKFSICFNASFLILLHSPAHSIILLVITPAYRRVIIATFQPSKRVKEVQVHTHASQA